MSAYVVFDITVNDPDKYEDYKEFALATIHTYGVKYPARSKYWKVNGSRIA